MTGRIGIAGLRLLAERRRRHALSSLHVPSVALVELTGLGDVIATLPAVQGFRLLFPSAGITLVVDEKLAELIRSFDLPCAVAGAPRSHSLWGVADAIRRVRGLEAALVCSMSPPRRNALVALASGAPYVAGYLRYTDTLTPFLLETPVEAFGVEAEEGITFGRESIGSRALKVCRALGLREAPGEIRLHIARRSLEVAHAQLLEKGMPTADRYVAIHPFAGWIHREWPLERFGDLAERIVQTTGLSVVFLWEIEKEGSLPQLRGRFAGERRVVFAPVLSLLETAVLISGASFFVGNDSGPLHLAAALGVRVVGLFGPSHPSLTAPACSQGAEWLYRGVDCSPCDQRACIRHTDSCMDRISVDDAMRAVENVRALSLERRPTHA